MGLATATGLPSLHPAQSKVKSEAARFNTLVCGRRWGKTTLGIELVAEPALEGYPAAWFSPTYKMLTEVWREMRRALLPYTIRISAQEHRIELTTGGVVDMWSLDNPDAARGRKYKRAGIDEAAMIAGLQEAVQQVIRPTLTDYIGDLWLFTTPRGMNYVKTLYDYGQDPLKVDFASWQMPTVANPFIDPEEVEKAREELPEMTFKQEYLAEFIQNEGAVFRNISANLTAPGNERPEAHKGHHIVAGVDWAQKHDFTAISVLCATCKCELELDRFNQISWDFQRGRLQAIAERWGVVEVLAEENSIGSPNIEALQGLGLPVGPFQTTATSKPPLIQSLALALEKQEFAWLSIAVATAELEAYESKVNANTGRASYSAPEGMNDDTVIARALALWCVVQPRKRMAFA